MGRYPVQERIEAEYGRPIRSLLTELYVVRGLSEARVGRELRTSQQRVHAMLVRLGIPRRRVRYQYEAEDLARVLGAGREGGK